MPPTKKRKATGDLESAESPAKLDPIIFKSPGLQPDVRLNVFDQEFHVHSGILKLHSAFFRKFLDSPEKPATKPSRKFAYEYVSVIDEDGEWGLEPVSMTPQNGSNNEIRGDRLKGREKKAFERIMRAMYNLPTKISAQGALSDMTRLADFYCMLPCLSYSLNASFMITPGFNNCRKFFPDIESDLELLKIAKKLRHPVIFREALIWVVSLWHVTEPALKMGLRKMDDRLFLAIISSYVKVVQLVAETSYAISLASICSGKVNAIVDEVSANHHENLKEHNSMGQAYYFRCPFEAMDRIPVPEWTAEVHQLRCMFYRVLENKLVLTRSEAYEAGKGELECQFICASIDDDELPWDSTETDW